MTEEQFCREQISVLMRHYQAEIKPYVDRIVEIESMKPLPPMIVDINDIPASVLEMLKVNFNG